MVIAESLVYPIEEAAELLKIGRSGAYEAARRGDIPVLRIGRRWLVPRIALDKMLADAGKGAEVAG